MYYDTVLRMDGRLAILFKEDGPELRAQCPKLKHQATTRSIAEFSDGVGGGSEGIAVRRWVSVTNIYDLKAR